MPDKNRNLTGSRGLRLARWLVMAGLCLSLVLTLSSGPEAGFSLGSLGKKVKSALKIGKAVQKASEDFTPEQEYYIGRAVGATVLSKYKPLNNPSVNKYLNLVGQALAQASDVPETFGGYHFLALDTKEINAFACPGGLILVSKGLLECCQSEDDLAAVLAHEIGHVQYKHGLKAIKQSRTTEVGKLLASEGLNTVGGGGLGKLVGLFSESIGDVVQTMMVSGYSRSQEREADEAAVIITSRVGYHPQGIIRVLTEMKKHFKPDSRGFAKTHPDPEERIKDLEPYTCQAGAYACPQVRETRFRKAVHQK